jgi:hypothetical protein
MLGAGTGEQGYNAYDKPSEYVKMQEIAIHV